jgi:hypothetical protein
MVASAAACFLQRDHRTPPSGTRVPTAPEVQVPEEAQVRAEVGARVVVQARAGEAARVAGSVRAVAQADLQNLETCSRALAPRAEYARA